MTAATAAGLLAVAACERPVPVDPFALSDAGLGPITKDTPFSVPVIADLYPDFIVEAGVVAAGDDRISVIRVVDGDQTLFTVLPGPDPITIDRIEIASPLIVLDNGAAVGDAFDSLLGPGADTEPPICARGVGAPAETVVCAAPRHAHIRYLFIGDWGGPADELPPLPILGQWRLAELLWLP